MYMVIIGFVIGAALTGMLLANSDRKFKEK